MYKNDIRKYAEIGDLSSIKQIIENIGVDNIGKYIIDRIILISCNNNNEEIVKYILSLNYLTNQNINYILDDVVATGNISITKLLIDKATTLDTTNALAISAGKNNQDLFNLLLPLCQQDWQLIDAFKQAVIKHNNKIGQILIPLLDQRILDESIIIAINGKNEQILDKLIPHCKDKLSSNHPLRWAVSNGNMKIFNKLLEVSNKKSLEDVLFGSVVYSKKEMIDVLFDHCDVVSIKDKLIKMKSRGEGLDYFLEKIKSKQVRQALEESLENIPSTKKKTKIM